jgi:hypothetical protein
MNSLDTPFAFAQNDIPVKILKRRGMRIFLAVSCWMEVLITYLNRLNFLITFPVYRM